MSCRSTHATSAATSAARLSEPTLDDTQVSALFHHLKRQGKAIEVEAPDRQAYLDGLEKLAFKVRTDPRLDDRAKQRVLARLTEAREEEPPDGPTWHATEMIGAHATVTVLRMERKFLAVASDMGIPVEKVEAVFHAWRAADPDAYEDKASPDRGYRYDLDPSMPTDESTQRALRKLGYEHYLAQPHPVFVYGTLRSGQGNDRLMDGAVDRLVPAHAPGVAVYGSSFGFPYAVEHNDPSAVTVGEVVWLTRDEAGERARQSLDYLEGFDSDHPSSSHYERVCRPVAVRAADGSTQTLNAWVYLARGNSRRSLREEDRIVAGDWVAERSRFVLPGKRRYVFE